MLSGCPCLSPRMAALIVGIIDVIVGPVGFIITTRLSMNPHLAEEMKFTNIHPELETNMTQSVLMSALQGLVLNEWVAFMVFYPPIFLTFLVGLQLLIAVHQQNYCVAKLSLILNYILVGFLLVLTIVMLFNGIRIESICFFIVSTIVQSYFLWIIFEFAMYELKYPSVIANCNGVYEQTTTICPDRFYDDDLNL